MLLHNSCTACKHGDSCSSAAPAGWLDVTGSLEWSIHKANRQWCNKAAFNSRYSTRLFYHSVSRTTREPVVHSIILWAGQLTNLSFILPFCEQDNSRTCRSFYHSVSRTTHEPEHRCRPNMVGMGKTWPSRSDWLLASIRVRMWILGHFLVFFTIAE